MKNVKYFFEDIHDDILDMLSWNDDNTYRTLIDYKKTNSLYQAIDKNKMWNELYGYVTDNYDDEEPSPSLDDVKNITKKYDKKLSELLYFLLDGLDED